MQKSLRTIVFLTLAVVLLAAGITVAFSVRKTRHAIMSMMERDAISLANILVEGARQVYESQRYAVTLRRSELMPLTRLSDPEVILTKGRTAKVRAVIVLDSTGKVRSIHGLTRPKEEQFLAKLSEYIDIEELKSNVAFIGLDPDFPSPSGPYGMAFASDDSIFVVFVEPPFCQEAGIGQLVRKLAQSPAVRYIILQDTSGVIAASKDVKEVKSILADDFLRSVFSTKTPQSRLTTFLDEQVFELAYPFPKLGEFSGIIRIGLPLAEYKDVMNLSRLVIILGLFLAILTVIVTIVLLSTAARLMRLRQEHERLVHLRALSELAASVAHQIRNPLNSIAIAFQRLAAEFKPEGNTEEYEKIINVGLSETKRVDKIIREFISLTGSISAVKNEVSTREFISKLCDRAAQLAQAKSVAFECDIPRDIPETILIDDEKLGHAVENILANSFDAVETGGTVRLSVRKAKRMLVLTIFNTGKPLNKEIAEKIFQPYASLKGKGAGMGLFYAQQVVLAHNGTIDVRNTSNGVAFDVKIPI